MVPKSREILELLKPNRILRLPEGHVLHGSHEYACWMSMHNRCRFDADYKHMLIQEEWFSFFVFLSDLGHAPSPEHTLDRIKNHEGYVRGNVRWATKAEQTRNRSCTIFLTIGEDTKPLAQWCEELDLNYDTCKKRYQRGWPPLEVLHGRRR